MTLGVFEKLVLFSFIHVVLRGCCRQTNATKGWNRREVGIKRADKRLGQDEKIQIIYVRI